MTKEQRIQAVKGAIELLTNNGGIFFICEALFVAFPREIKNQRDYTIEGAYAYSRRLFPELEKLIPIITNKNSNNCWFDINEQGRQSRLEILNKLLTEIQEQ